MAADEVKCRVGEAPANIVECLQDRVTVLTPPVDTTNRNREPSSFAVAPQARPAVVGAETHDVDLLGRYSVVGDDAPGRPSARSCSSWSPRRRSDA